MLIKKIKFEYVGQTTEQLKAFLDANDLTINNLSESQIMDELDIIIGKAALGGNQTISIAYDTNNFVVGWRIRSKLLPPE